MIKYLSKRKGFSLIEIIVTIVITAITMITIPKILKIVNKSMLFVKKQEAIFNGASRMSEIIKKNWDDNNSNSNLAPLLEDGIYSLAFSTGSVIDCNDSGTARIGDFENNSRQCLRGGTDNNYSYTGSSIGPELGAGDYSDIDDYDGVSSEINVSETINTPKYRVDSNASYLQPLSGFWAPGSTSTSIVIDLSKTIRSSSPQHMKIVKTTVKYAPNYRNYNESEITSFTYISPNIGVANIAVVQ